MNGIDFGVISDSANIFLQIKQQVITSHSVLDKEGLYIFVYL